MSGSRILHVPRRFVAGEWGGTETSILQIAREQQAAGAAPEVHTSLALSDVRAESIGGVPVRRYPYFYPALGLTEEDVRAFDKKGGNLVSPALLAALVRARGVRLYHAHATERLGAHVRTAARLRGLPYVVSLHGGVFALPAAERARLLRRRKRVLEWGRVVSLVLGSRRVLRDADHVVCLNEEEARRARVELGHARVSVLPNGVDAARFSPGGGAPFRARHGIPEGALLVACIARIDAQKSQELLFEALPELRHAHGDVRLVCVGPVTQPAYAEKLEARARSLGIAAFARLLPPLSPGDDAIVDAYRAADVVALPSMHEPFGIAVLEAWACARPVVTSRAGALGQLVVESAGLTFDEGAPDAAAALGAALSELCASEERRRAMGERGREMVCAHYRWSHVAARLETIYRSAEEHALRRRS
jgi:glycosyltransferase involved in cell wall biosynthesis